MVVTLDDIRTTHHKYGGVSISDRLVRDNDCFVWSGAKDQLGYGLVSIRNRLCRIHRAVYEAYMGEIPEGLEIDHLCRNRTCANVAHLEAVTHATNMQRSVAWERFGMKPYCKHGHEMTEENTHFRQRGGRECRECMKLRTRAYREKAAST